MTDFAGNTINAIAAVPSSPLGLTFEGAAANNDAAVDGDVSARQPRFKTLLNGPGGSPLPPSLSDTIPAPSTKEEIILHHTYSLPPTPAPSEAGDHDHDHEQALEGVDSPVQFVAPPHAYDEQERAAEGAGAEGAAAATHPRGATMVVVDVSDQRALLSSSVLAKLDPSRVRGIFHLAGVLDDGLLAGMSEQRLRKVATPKLAASHLGALSRERGWAVRSGDRLCLSGQLSTSVWTAVHCHVSPPQRSSN